MEPAGTMQIANYKEAKRVHIKESAGFLLTIPKETFQVPSFPRSMLLVELLPVRCHMHSSNKGSESTATRANNFGIANKTEDAHDARRNHKLNALTVVAAGRVPTISVSTRHTAFWWLPSDSLHDGPHPAWPIHLESKL